MKLIKKSEHFERTLDAQRNVVEQIVSANFTVADDNGAEIGSANFSTGGFVVNIRRRAESLDESVALVERMFENINQ